MIQCCSLCSRIHEHEDTPDHARLHDVDGVCRDTIESPSPIVHYLNKSYPERPAQERPRGGISPT